MLTKRRRRNRALTSSVHMDYETPRYFLDIVEDHGPILFDPATSPTNPTAARVYATKDGLFAIGGRCVSSDVSGKTMSSWVGAFEIALEGYDWDERPKDGVIFLNPEYGAELSTWVDCVRSEVRSPLPKGCHLYVLVPARTDARWFRTMVEHADAVVFWSSPEHGSRIRFKHASLDRKLVKWKADCAVLKRKIREGKTDLSRRLSAIARRRTEVLLKRRSTQLATLLRKKPGNDSAMFPCAVFYFGGDVDRFQEVMGPHGTFSRCKGSMVVPGTSKLSVAA